MKPPTGAGGRPASSPRRAILAIRRVPLVAAFCVAALVHSGPAAHAGAGPSGRYLGELARALEAAPPISPRLSIVARGDPRGRRLAASVPGASASPGGRGPAGRGVGGLVARAGPAARRGDLDAAHALALVDVVWGTGKSLDRAISSLHQVARLSDRPAAALADVSAAYLVRAERGGSPRDLLSALEAAEEALERDPASRAALFNRALAIQLFGLVEEAAAEWRAYLAVDPTSRWADDARRLLREARAVPLPPPPPAADAEAAEHAAYAAADPQGGRELGWCTVLGDWAASLLAGDRAGAEDRLEGAAALGGALERRPGGDASLADAVRAIRAAGTAARRELARGHHELAAGCALEELRRYEDAAPRYHAAAAAAHGSPALRAWGRMLYGNARFRAGDAPHGEPVLREWAGSADAVRHPALAARARLSLASLRARGDRHETALPLGREAADLFSRAGEHRNAAAALEGLAVTQFGLGDTDEAYGTVRLTLERMRPGGAPERLHALLAATAHYAAEDGFARAAIRIQDEGVRAAARTGGASALAEAHLARSRLLAATGALGRAREDLVAGRRALRKLDEGGTLRWMTAERQMAQAALGAPALAAGALDSATTFFLGRDIPLRALPAVVGGAEARLALGDVAGAAERLERAVEMLEQRRDSVRMEARRAAVFEAARGLVDRLVLLELAAGRAESALGYLDRGRASLAPAGRAAAKVDHAVRGPHGEVVLEYAVVADTLLVWTVSGRRVEVHRAPIDTVSLVRTIERLRSDLEAGREGAGLRPVLADLYDRLIRPVAARLGAPGTPLVVVADGDLAGVPFAALLDARRGRYLVEDHPLRFAVSLREARRGRQRSRGTAERALFVSDPAFDRREHQGLDRLPHAAAEVQAIRTEYPNAEVLSESNATRAALKAALGRAGVVHYAGHAVFDDERPERSHLVLAPTSGEAGSGRLTAAELAAMDLDHVRLVVLAACQTIRSGRGRAAGFTGLVGSLLAAGADGAVGTLWQVDDGRTRRLMVEFHRAYSASGDAAASLRTAQLRLLGSGDPALSSPAAWAGFRYTGQ